MGIDPQTGIPGRFPDSDKRFASHPYVGSRYGESTRILFIWRYPESKWKANPLSFVGLTNFYKWTTIRRDRASGGSDRQHLSPEVERRFVMDEIRLYEPEAVVFQGAGFRNRPHLAFVERVSRECEVRVLRHPSMRGRRRPKDVGEVWGKGRMEPRG